jgi:type IV pilus assembly protein PilQ
MTMPLTNLIFGAFFASAQLVSLDSREMDLSDFFRLMANIANMNVVLHPGVQGKVNLMIKDAPWQQVLDLVMKNHGLEKEVAGNTMRIAPVAVFDAERAQTAATEEARLKTLPLETRFYLLNYAKAEDVAMLISKMLSPRGSVIAYRPLNAVIVTDVVRPAEAPR